MNSWLAKAGTAGKRAWNVTRSLGTLIIAQSDRASEAVARHRGRLASVDSTKELISKEIEIYADVKKKLLHRWIDAPVEEKIRLSGDIEDIEARLRQAAVVMKALEYSHTANEPESVTPEQPEISSHWLDRFNDLARAHNEDWREDLLGRALAAESAQPGSVSPRALWVLGTLEEPMFRAFATVLDLCATVGAHLIIPSPDPFLDEVIPNSEFAGETSLGHLVFALSDLELLARDEMILEFKSDIPFQASYGKLAFSVKELKGAVKIKGIMLTNLGAAIGSFCNRKHNPLGQRIFDTWIGQLRDKGCTITSSDSP